MRVVVLSQDSTLAGRLNKDDNLSSFTVVKDLPELKEAMASQSYNGVVIESNGCKLEEFCALNGSIDLSKKFLLAGSLPTVETLDHLVNDSADRQTGNPTPQNGDLNLVDYVEAKFSGFVRAMKRGSARDLYPTLMRTVERPLIELALRETKGNQLQASQLLGMNRNTLRKKISEYKISVGRYKTNQAAS